jgi:hypothetical protein
VIHNSYRHLHTILENKIFLLSHLEEEKIIEDFGGCRKGHLKDLNVESVIEMDVRKQNVSFWNRLK